MNPSEKSACVLTGRGPASVEPAWRTWCGRNLDTNQRSGRNLDTNQRSGEFMFPDAADALRYLHVDGDVVERRICPACAREMMDTLALGLHEDDVPLIPSIPEGGSSRPSVSIDLNAPMMTEAEAEETARIAFDARCIALQAKGSWEKATEVLKNELRITARAAVTYDRMRHPRLWGRAADVAVLPAAPPALEEEHLKESAVVAHQAMRDDAFAHRFDTQAQTQAEMNTDPAQRRSLLIVTRASIEHDRARRFEADKKVIEAMMLERDHALDVCDAAVAQTEADGSECEALRAKIANAREACEMHDVACVMGDKCCCHASIVRRLVLDALDGPSSPPAAAPVAPAVPDGPVPLPRWNDLLDALRAAGWSVAVHNDYRVKGVPQTFWLFTHPDHTWIKGEGCSDEEALRVAHRHWIRRLLNEAIAGSLPTVTNGASSVVRSNPNPTEAVGDVVPQSPVQLWEWTLIDGLWFWVCVCDAPGDGLRGIEHPIAREQCSGCGRKRPSDWKDRLPK